MVICEIFFVRGVIGNEWEFGGSGCDCGGVYETSDRVFHRQDG